MYIKVINFVADIGKHPNHVVLKTFEEYGAITGRPNSAYLELVVETQQRYYKHRYTHNLSTLSTITFPKKTSQALHFI